MVLTPYTRKKSWTKLDTSNMKSLRFNHISCLIKILEKSWIPYKSLNLLSHSDPEWSRSVKTSKIVMKVSSVNYVLTMMILRGIYLHVKSWRNQTVWSEPTLSTKICSATTLLTSLRSRL